MQRLYNQYTGLGERENISVLKWADRDYSIQNCCFENQFLIILPTKENALTKISLMDQGCMCKVSICKHLSH